MIIEQVNQTVKSPEIPLDPEMAKEIILKVQLPIAGYGEVMPALFYNEDRTIAFSSPVTEELVALLSQRNKSFWTAWIYSTNNLPLEHDDCNREVWLEKEAAYQNW